MSSDDAENTILADDFSDGSLSEYQAVGRNYWGSNFGSVELVEESTPDGSNAYVQVEDHEGWGSKYVLVTNDEFDWSGDYEFEFLVKSDFYPSSWERFMGTAIGWEGDTTEDHLGIQTISRHGGPKPLEFRGAHVESSTTYDVDWKPETWFWIRGEVRNSEDTARAKAWEYGTSEPSDYQIEAQLGPNRSKVGEAFIMANGKSGNTMDLDVSVMRWGDLPDEEASVTAKTTALSYIPGDDEDSIGAGAYGHPLNSAVVDVFEGEYVFDFDIDKIDLGWLGEHDLGWDVFKVKATPPFDAWGTGDEIESLPPMELQEATAPEENKYRDEFPGEAHKQYRVLNTVGISFETDGSGTIDDDSIQVTFDGDRTDTVMEAEDINTLDPELIGAKESDGSYYFHGGEVPRMWNQRVIERDGVEGVQVSTIFGGYTKVAAEVMKLATEYDDLKFLHDVLGWEFQLGGREVDDVLDELPEEIRSIATPEFSEFMGMLSQVPNIFTFLEFTVFADGRRVVRLWDASMFPRHALYLDGTRFDSTSLPYQPRERLNAHFLAFLGEASSRLATPYYAPEWAYKEHVLNDTFDDLIRDTIEEWVGWVPQVDVDELLDYSDISQHAGGSPIVQYGERDDGTELPEGEIGSLMPLLPFWPFN